MLHRGPLDRSQGQPLALLSPSLDTRERTALSRLNATIWGFGDYNYAIYGVMRRELLVGLQRWPSPYPPTLAPDHVMLGELALLGEVILHPEVLFSLRRMSDYADFDAYLQKTNTGVHSRREALRTYGNLIAAMGSLSRGHELSPPQRAAASVSGIAAGTINYLGMARGLLTHAAGKRRAISR